MFFLQNWVTCGYIRFAVGGRVWCFFSSNGRSAPMIVCNLFVYFQLSSSKINYVEIDVCSKCERYTWVRIPEMMKEAFFDKVRDD